MAGLDISFQPLLPLWLLGLIAGLGVLLILPALLARARGGWLRLSFLGALLAALANPQLLSEERQALSDIVVAAVDRSPSNRLGPRQRQTDAALAALRRELRASGGELRVVETPRQAQQSEVFSPLLEAARDVPAGRLSSAVILSDGRIDDAERAGALEALDQPVHALLTGDPEMIDRRIEIVNAPEYALVDREARVTLEIREENFASQEPVALTIRRPDGERQTRRVQPGEPVEITLVPERRGKTILDLAVEPAEGERVTLNNRALLSINAVRDRLRVLLVSGEPHPGERVWRASLKSDPAVDLIHFTILRLPTSQDPTPVSQLSLIPFPTERLFAQQLNEFDLVIFDRYTLRGVLELRYFENLLAYVRKGGGVFVANGPEFAGETSLYQTPLAEILPAEPSGGVIKEGFRAGVTETGRRHPVTAPLAGPRGEEPSWGRWFRAIESSLKGGEVLLEAGGGRPLLVLDRVGEGRIAQLMSDHVWLWARDIEGGGPYRELLRRSVHWLMKEPELEERALRARGADGDLVIERRSLETEPAEVTVTGPEDFERRLTLEPGEDGLARRRLAVPSFGLYRVREGEREAVAGVGPTGGHELSRVVPTAGRVRAPAEATGGGVYWIEEGVPELRRPAQGATAAGADWLGLPRREASRVEAVEERPLLPAWVWALLLSALLAAAWWRESR